MVRFGGKFWFSEPPALTAQPEAITATATGAAQRSRSLPGELAVTAITSGAGHLKKQMVTGDLVVTAIRSGEGTATTHAAIGGALASTIATPNTITLAPPLRYSNSVSAAAASAAIPAHSAGDVLVVFTYNTSGTIPSTPSAGGTVPTWLAVDSLSGNTNAGKIVYCIATANNHTSGTFSNAELIVTVVLTGGQATPALGGHARTTGGQTNPVAPAITLGTADGTSAVLGFFGFSYATSWGAAPAGWTQRQQTVMSYFGICLDTKNATTSDGSCTQPVSGYSGLGRHFAAQVEFRSH